VDPSSRPRDHEEDSLGRDVDALGRMLGEVLREQEGEAGFALVEEVSGPRPRRCARRADGLATSGRTARPFSNVRKG
jgi:phosphoenolpyruvate carboxylase